MSQLRSQRGRSHKPARRHHLRSACRSCIESLESRCLLAFAHPSITNTEADFTRMATKVAAGEQPWQAGWNALTSDAYSQLGASPRPLVTVIRGGTDQNFNQMVIDIQRTYELALRWKISGDTQYANLAVTFLNSWSSTMTTLTGNADRFLASGLYAYGWAAAAEIMRTYPGWTGSDVTAFQDYLLNVYYPLQDDFLYGGDDGVSHNGAAITNYWANWDLANIEGMMAIGIFADRQDIYDSEVNYLYHGGGNGALDKAAYYLHPGNLMQWQESGRDQGHTTLGMGLFGHIAQMTWNQGLDLFAYNNYQFLAAAEYVAKYNLGFDVPYQTYMWGTGQSGSWQQQTTLGSGSRGNGRPVYELIYNHYVQRLGMAAPYSTQRVMSLRPEWRGNGDELGFGTLTYALDGLSAPQPPRGLTAAEKGAGNVQLDWFGGANVTSYNLYRATSIDGTYAEVASGISDLLSYTDRDLTAGVYYYKVTGLAGANETAASNIVSATSTHLLQTQLPFNESSGAIASDASGNGHTGTLNNGATWTTGKTGNAVLLDGTNDYVSLPADLVGDLSDFTISSWVYLNSAATWSRIFDFGDDRGRWMFLTPRNGGGVVEFATSTVYGYNKQWVTGPSALPTNQWVHVAVTLADHVGTLYVNGVAVGSNPNMDFPPMQIGSTPNNWIGRSQFSADPYLNGRVDDFQIHRGALKPGEIYTQATGLAAPAVPAAPATLSAAAVPGNSINLTWSAVPGATAGYTVKRATTDGGPYTTIATRLSATSFADTGRTAGTRYYYVVVAGNNGGESAPTPQASAVALPPMPSAPTNLTGNSTSPTSVTLWWTGGADAANYILKRSLTSGGPYTTIADDITTTTYTDSEVIAGTTYYYVVTAVNASGQSANSNQAAATPSSLHLRLRFDEASGTNASDSTGNLGDALLVNGPVWTSGKLNSGVNLDGVDDHISLPSSVVNGLSACTIAAWVQLDAVSTWSRIFDFGSGTSNYMFLTPRNGANGFLRLGIKTSASATEEQINTSIAWPTGVWRHVAFTLNGSLGILYVNGVEVGRNSSMTLAPSSLGATTQNYLGKSQFASDAYLDGSIDDFRIYSLAITAAQVSQLASLAPPAAPTGLTAAPGDGQVALSWAAVAGASSYTLRRATVSGGPYTTIATAITATSTIDTAVANDTPYFYVVSAVNIVDESTASTEASATPVAPTNVTLAQHAWQTSPNQLSFTFARDVGAEAFTLASLSIQRLAGGGTIAATGFSYDSASWTATWTLPSQISNGDYVATLAAGHVLAADHQLPFFILAGDVNRDRRVDITDLATLATNWQGTGKTFSDGDLNYDGEVDIADLAILATNWQTSSAPPLVARAAQSKRLAVLRA